MKKIKLFICTKIRNVKNKLVIFSLIYLFLSLLSCQTGRWADSHTLGEKIRINQARELLNLDYDRLKISQLEFDYGFNQYLKQYIKSVNPNINADEFIPDLLLQSKNQNYDPVFLIAIMKTESKFNINAIGAAGEIGLMQIKPSTAEWFCDKIGVRWKGKEALKNPSYNLEIGAKYFTYLKKALNEKSPQYINAYNMGLNNLQRLPASVRIFHPYYHRVMRNYVEIYQELQKIKEKEIKS